MKDEKVTQSSLFVTYRIMVNKYRQWFPTMDRFGKLSFAEKLKDTAGILDAGKMVLFDVCIHLPLMYFPSYYTLKEFVSGSSWNPADWVIDGTRKYVSNAKEDLTAMIKLWGPSDCVQFVLPMHIRMPFRHMVSFFWTAYGKFQFPSIINTTEPILKAIPHYNRLCHYVKCIYIYIYIYVYII